MGAAGAARCASASGERCTELPTRPPTHRIAASRSLLLALSAESSFFSSCIWFSAWSSCADLRLISAWNCDRQRRRVQGGWGGGEAAAVAAGSSSSRAGGRCIGHQQVGRGQQQHGGGGRRLRGAARCLPRALRALAAPSLAPPTFSTPVFGPNFCSAMAVVGPTGLNDLEAQ